MRLALGAERFPVNVEEAAFEVSRNRCADDPIVEIVPAALDGFEGMLAPRRGKGWRILYNDTVTSSGRIRFTLAHEFGHYLMHRDPGRSPFACSLRDMSDRSQGEAAREREANEFAATWLMPLDDFRARLAEEHLPTPDDLSQCADAYGVSFMAASLRWLEYTSVSAMLIASRDDFMLWACSSRRALREQAFLRTRTEIIPMPEAALVSRSGTDTGWRSLEQPADVWFGRECLEYSVSSDQHDLQLTLLLLGERPDDASTDREG